MVNLTDDSALSGPDTCDFWTRSHGRVLEPSLIPALLLVPSGISGEILTTFRKSLNYLTYAISDSRCYIMHSSSVLIRWFISVKFLHWRLYASVICEIHLCGTAHSLEESDEQVVAVLTEW